MTKLCKDCGEPIIPDDYLGTFVNPEQITICSGCMNKVFLGYQDKIALGVAQRTKEKLKEELTNG